MPAPVERHQGGASTSSSTISTSQPLRAGGNANKLQSGDGQTVNGHTIATAGAGGVKAGIALNMPAGHPHRHAPNSDGGGGGSGVGGLWPGHERGAGEAERSLSVGVASFIGDDDDGRNIPTRAAASICADTALPGAMGDQSMQAEVRSPKSSRIELNRSNVGAHTRDSPTHGGNCGREGGGKRSGQGREGAGKKDRLPEHYVQELFQNYDASKRGTITREQTCALLIKVSISDSFLYWFASQLRHELIANLSRTCPRTCHHPRTYA